MKFSTFITGIFILICTCILLESGVGDNNQSSGLFGTYMIHTDPIGSDIYIQEKYYGKTPLLYIPDNHIIPPWTIHIRKDGYRNHTCTITENIKPGEQKQIFVTLIPVPNYGTISVHASPDGCLAQLDGNASVPLPYLFTFVPEGMHTLFVTKTGYKSYLNEKVSVQKDEETAIKITLIPNNERKELVITSTPPDVEILVDGIYRGKTTRDIPLVTGSLNDGKHTILGRLSGYQDTELTVVTRQDLSTNVHLNLIPINGIIISSALKIRSIPQGSDVLLNGIWVGEVPSQGFLFLEDVPPNRYKITISKEGFKDHTEWVFPEPGETIIIDTILERMGS